MVAWIKPPLFLAALLPLARLLALAAGIGGSLGANPVETIEHQTGLWSLYCLLATLAITPLRRLTGLNAVARLRRMLGLYAFFYALLHFAAWLVFDHALDLLEIVKDIRKRPYVTVGFLAFTLLVPLAATSTDSMVRRLGGARWRALHSLVYVTGTLAILHFLWLVKADRREPILYGIILVALLMSRAPAFLALGSALRRRRRANLPIISHLADRKAA